MNDRRMVKNVFGCGSRVVIAEVSCLGGRGRRRRGWFSARGARWKRRGAKLDVLPREFGEFGAFAAAYFWKDERVRRNSEGCRSQVGDTISSACRYARGTRVLGVEGSVLVDRWSD